MLLLQPVPRVAGRQVLAVERLVAKAFAVLVDPQRVRVAAFPRRAPQRFALVGLAGHAVPEEHAEVVAGHAGELRADFTAEDQVVAFDVRLAHRLPLGQALVVLRKIRVPVVAAAREHDAALGANEEVLAVPFGAHADDPAAFADQLAHRGLGERGDVAVDASCLDEVRHHARAEAADVLRQALAHRRKVPLEDARQAAPLEQLVVGDAGGHVRGRRVGLLLPLAEGLAAEQLDLEVTAVGHRAGGVREVVVGEVLDDLPFHAGLLFEIPSRFGAFFEERFLQVVLRVTAGEEVEVSEASVAVVWFVFGRHLVIARHEHFAARVRADAAELRCFVEHGDFGPFVVRDDGGGERAEARAYGDDIDLQIPVIWRCHVSPSQRTVRSRFRRGSARAHLHEGRAHAPRSRSAPSRARGGPRRR